MRFAFFLILISLVIPGTAASSTAILPIAGSVNEFRTDTRILNPSFEKDIVINGWFLPAGNLDNSAIGAGPPQVTLTIGRRQMRVFDDSVQSIFNTTGLGSILLFSNDPFIASSRIYAQTANGTLGQFVPAGSALFRGAVIGLKSSAGFRTNIGVASAVNGPATITFKLYDRNNTLVASGPAITMPAYATIAPTSITSPFFFNAGSADLTDAWVSFEADQPVVVYASVVDNLTRDPTFIPATQDVGVPPVEPPSKTFTITARQWNFDIAEAAQIRVKKGDRVVLNITSRDVVHGISIERYAPSPLLLLNNQTARIEFTADTVGTFQYFCTESGCGTGHISMADEIVVEP